MVEGEDENVNASVKEKLRRRTARYRYAAYREDYLRVRSEARRLGYGYRRGLFRRLYWLIWAY